MPALCCADTSARPQVPSSPTALIATHRPTYGHPSPHRSNSSIERDPERAISLARPVHCIYQTAFSRSRSRRDAGPPLPSGCTPLRTAPAAESCSRLREPRPGQPARVTRDCGRCPQLPFFLPLQRAEEFTEEVCRALIHSAAGQAALPDLTVHSIRPWTMSAEVRPWFSPPPPFSPRQYSLCSLLSDARGCIQA